MRHFHKDIQGHIKVYGTGTGYLVNKIFKKQSYSSKTGKCKVSKSQRIINLHKFQDFHQEKNDFSLS